MRTLGLLAAFVAALGLSQPAALAAGSGKLGVVLMHGADDDADHKKQIDNLAKEMAKSGFLIATPEMPWSKARILDKTYEETMAEIEKHVEALKKQGAQRIALAGHGLGANAAIGYAARHDGVVAVVAISPAHTPDEEDVAKAVAPELKRARDMVAAGKGGEKAVFKNPERGRKATLAVTAKIYVDWFDPKSPSTLPGNAARMKPDTALIWVIGDRGTMSTLGKRYAFAKAPANSNNVYKLVNGGPDTTIKRGAGDIVLWLSRL